VNPETVHLVERPYAEVVDDVLTAILGGVVNEPIEFDLRADAYPLSRPAAAVRSVTGSVAETDPATGESVPRPLRFLPGIDWEFAPGSNELVWVEGGRSPADETVFYVDYLPAGARPPLTDVAVGSVTRTLAEAVGREIAGVYEQVDEAYRSAFLDTARGRSLDLVVAILGVERKSGEYAAGSVSFYRDPAAGDGDVAIVEGVALRTADGKAGFVTAELRVLQRGQARVDVPVRAAGASRGPAGVVPAGTIGVLARPLLGIARVANTEPTALGAAAETDEQLRARARAAIRGLGSATVAALKLAVEEQGARLGELWDPESAAVRAAPGTVTLLVEAEPERFAQVADAVHRTRAAGVLATVAARYVYFRPRLRITVPAGTPPAGQLKAVAQVLAAMQGYVDTLAGGDDVVGSDLLDAVRAVAPDAAFADVVAWVSGVRGDPPAAVAERTVASLPTDLPGREALEAALAAALEESLPGAPTGARRPAREQVRNEAGTGQATPEEIAAARFRVSARVGEEDWWIFLDAGAADVQLTKG
jgi:hypothetical protein